MIQSYNTNSKEMEVEIDQLTDSKDAIKKSNTDLTVKGCILVLKVHYLFTEGLVIIIQSLILLPNQLNFLITVL